MRKTWDRFKLVTQDWDRYHSPCHRIMKTICSEISPQLAFLTNCVKLAAQDWDGYQSPQPQNNENTSDFWRRKKCCLSAACFTDELRQAIYFVVVLQGLGPEQRQVQGFKRERGWRGVLSIARWARVITHSHRVARLWFDIKRLSLTFIEDFVRLNWSSTVRQSFDAKWFVDMTYQNSMSYSNL